MVLGFHRDSTPASSRGGGDVLEAARRRRGFAGAARRRNRHPYRLNQGRVTADLPRLRRRSLASISRASITLAGLALHDHASMHPAADRLLKADDAVKRLYWAERRGRVA
jgi:hypothetical protein